MNALRTSLMTLVATFALTACGPADAFVSAENDSSVDAESELAATVGKFETFQGKDGQYYFHLLAGNGQKVLASQGYASQASAISGVESVRSNAVNAQRYLQREASDGSFYFVVTATNGQIIGVSEMYVSKTNADRGATTVQAVVANIVSSGQAVQGDTRFETFKGLDGKYYFHLKAHNGEIVLASQGYSTKTSATGGIASVKANGAQAARYEVRAAADGSYYFVLKAANGAVIGRSEMYVSKSNAEAGVTAVVKLVGESK